MSKYNHGFAAPLRKKRVLDLQSRSMTPHEVAYHIHDHLIEKGFTDYKFTINGVRLDFEHEGDALNCLALFLTNPLDRFTIEISNPDFNIQLYRSSKGSAVICQSQPFGFLARSVTRHIYRMIQPYTKTFYQKDLKTVLALYYGSVQFAALPELKAFISHKQLDSEWSRAILAQPDNTPLVFDSFMVLLEKFGSQDLKALAEYRKKVSKHEFLRIIQVFDLLEEIRPLIIDGKIPLLVSEHLGELNIQRGKRFIKLNSDLEGMLHKGRYTYDGFQVDQLRLLSSEHVQAAPEELMLSLEQLAFIEQQISRQGVSSLDISVRLHHIKEEWKRLRKSSA